MLVLDTNVIVEYSHKHIEIFSWLDTLINKKEIFIISVLSITELLGYGSLPEVERLRYLEEFQK